jgi:hypothetical protein
VAHERRRLAMADDFYGCFVEEKDVEAGERAKPVEKVKAS